MENALAQFLHHFFDVLGGIEVDEEGVVTGFHLRAVEGVEYESRFAHTPWSDERHVVAIAHFPDKVDRFLFTVAEKFVGHVAAQYKWIVGHLCLPSLSGIAKIIIILQ